MVLLCCLFSAGLIGLIWVVYRLLWWFSWVVPVYCVTCVLLKSSTIWFICGYCFGLFILGWWVRFGDFNLGVCCVIGLMLRLWVIGQLAGCLV